MTSVDNGRESRRRGGRAQPRSSGPPPGLFADVLFDPARERLPGAAPVVSLREGDDPAYLAEVRRRARRVLDLRRRGRWHGQLAELEPAGLLGPPPRRRRREADEAQRWVAARPLLLSGAASAAVAAAGRARPDPRALHALLGTPAPEDAFAAWLRGAALAPRFRPDGPAPLADPERDLARVLLASDDGFADLWVKLGRLSTHPADRSLRVRVSFGVEGEDDASRDARRLRAVGELGGRLLPGAAAAEEAARATLERLLGGTVLFTQHIAYWNAPEGGTLFHHDAFTEEAEGGQRGVAFCQLDGESVWLALSVEDLAWRVREFVAWVEEGDLPWLVEELGAAGLWSPVRALAGGPREELLAELARPGCGRLGVLVDRGPEFTSFLVDSGHAVVLHAGDVLLLPNHGPTRTAMHAVFSGSPRTSYGVSLAIRRVDELG